MILIAMPVMADVTPNTKVATTSYVRGAVQTKQDTLTSTNVTATGSSNAGAVVTAVTASNGTVTVTKSDLAVPVKSSGTVTGTANIWFE